MNTIETIQQELNTAIEHIYSLTPEITKTFSYTINSDEQRLQFGDISSNAALILAKQLSKNPREVAQTIAEKFQHQLVENYRLSNTLSIKRNK